ncbi:MAG TPA: APC family permease, partial [Steroidobacteraceae bacterium]
MDTGQSSDERNLERWGYRQELRRTLGNFSNFAITFSVVSITTGLFANYGNGLREAGPAFIWTWPLVGAGQLLLAVVFARLAREIPLSGYAYHWARNLAGDEWAWWAGWMMILQFLTGMPGVCYALATYLSPYLGLAPTNSNIVALTIAGLVLIALINHFGIRLASWGNNVTVLAEIGGSGLVGIILLVVALRRHTNSAAFLVSHPGHSSGLPYLGAFAFSSLMSAWTITGFEQAANLAEETHQPERRVPRIILFSEVFGVGLGFLVLLGFTLAIPSLGAVQNQSTPLLFVMGRYFPPAVTRAEMVLVFVAMFGSALANITTLTRMVYSMARDDQLPASPWLARVSRRRVPANAIWTVTILASLFVLWARFEVIITGIATLAGYATYAIIVGATLRRKAAQHEGLPPAESPQPSAPRAELERSTLSICAFAWLLIVLVMLSLPRAAWTNSVATLIAVAVGGLWYGLSRPAQRRKAQGTRRPGPLSDKP